MGTFKEDDRPTINGTTFNAELLLNLRLMPLVMKMQLPSTHIRATRQMQTDSVVSGRGTCPEND